MIGIIRKKIGRSILLIMPKTRTHLLKSAKLLVRRTAYVSNSSSTELPVQGHIRSDLALSARRRKKEVIVTSQVGIWRELGTGQRKPSVKVPIGWGPTPESVCIRHEKWYILRKSLLELLLRWSPSKPHFLGDISLRTWIWGYYAIFKATLDGPLRW